MNSAQLTSGREVNGYQVNDMKYAQVLTSEILRMINSRRTVDYVFLTSGISCWHAYTTHSIVSSLPDGSYQQMLVLSSAEPAPGRPWC